MRARLLFTAALALPLAGCISLGPKTPDRLITLTAASPLAAGPARTADDKSALAVTSITAIPALGTQRVLVTDGAAQLAYLKDGLWAAPPAQLFRGLLAETITQRTGRVVPDTRLLSAQPDTRLSGQLSAFGLDGPGQAVTVTFDAAITRSGTDRLEARRFSARLPVAAEDPATVAAALNQAANQVAGEVADWVGR